METKKNSTRGRPKKDFWELKEKINKEAAENKWKFWRWRPKKEKKIDDSVNTKISNHHKDIKELEKKNNEIHKNIKNVSINSNYEESKKEKYSRIILGFSLAFFLCAVMYTIVYRVILPFSNNIDSSVSNSENNEDIINMQIWYNDQSWEFVEFEKVEIDNSKKEDTQNETMSNNQYVDLIQSFYDKINNRKFSELSDMADIYLKKSDSFKSYFNENWLSKFLNKIAWNKVYIWEFNELPSTKADVIKYWYTVKYKVNWNNNLTKEQREIAIVNRDGKDLIWSIMCITTWCSKMPFFQP